MKKKHIVLLVLGLLLIFGVIFFLSIPNKPEGATDVIQLYEISESSQERLELKLIDEYRGNIHYSWGEPDETVPNIYSNKYYLDDNDSEYFLLYYDSYIDKYYLDDTQSEYITLYYGSDNYIIDFEFGNE